MGLLEWMGLEIIAHRYKHTDLCSQKLCRLGVVAITRTEIRLSLLRPAGPLFYAFCGVKILQFLPKTGFNDVVPTLVLAKECFIWQGWVLNVLGHVINPYSLQSSMSKKS